MSLTYLRPFSADKRKARSACTSLPWPFIQTLIRAAGEEVETFTSLRLVGSSHALPSTPAPVRTHSPPLDRATSVQPCPPV
eukprot:750250-Hanusia_phi.AAC.2